jgi:hypothetical protein
VKASDQGVTNSATLVNDSELLFAVAASTTYQFEAYLICNAAGNNATDCKVTFTVPAGATIRWSGFYVDASDSSLTAIATVSASGTTVNLDVTTATADATARILGTVENGGTAGSLQLQFANNAAGAGRITTMKAGSYLKVSQ